MSSKVSGGGSFFGVTASASVELGSSSANAADTRDARAASTAHVSISTSILGPAAPNLEMFERMLNASNKTWRIIDRGDPRAFTPIWDVLERAHPEHASIARILRAAYRHKASLILREQARGFEADISAASTAQAPAKDALNNRTALALASLNLSPPADEVDGTVRLAALARCLLSVTSSTGMDPCSAAFARPEVQGFLECIATHPRMHTVQQLAKSLFSPVLIARLRSGGLVLSRNIMAMLTPRADAADAAPPPPVVPITLDLNGLEGALRAIAEHFASNPSSMHTQTAAAINTAVKNSSMHPRAVAVHSVLRQLGRNDAGVFAIEYNSIANVEYAADRVKEALTAQEVRFSPLPIDASPTLEMHLNVRDLNPDGIGLEAIAASRGTHSSAVDELLYCISTRQDVHRLTSVKADAVSSMREASTSTVTTAALEARKMPVNKPVNVFGDSDSSDGECDDKGIQVATAHSRTSGNVANDSIVKLANSLNLPARCTVFEQLLKQRRTVPLLTKRTSALDAVPGTGTTIGADTRTGDNVQFCNHSQALRYAETQLSSRNINLLHDETLLRVAVVSDIPVPGRNVCSLVKELFSLPTFNTDEAATSAPDIWLGELGIGFLKPPSAEPGSASHPAQPCTVLLLCGDVQPALPLLRNWADVVLVETQLTAGFISPSANFIAADEVLSQRTKAWCLGLEDRGNVRVDGMKVRHERMATLVNFFTASLLKPAPRGDAAAFLSPIRDDTERKPLHACGQSGRTVFVSDIVQLDDIDALLQRTDIPGLRSQLCLQRSFAIETDMVRQKGKAVEPMQIVRLEHQISIEQSHRQKLLASTRPPLALRLLLDILGMAEDPANSWTIKCMALMELTAVLARMNEEQLRPRIAASRAASQAWQNAKRGGNTADQKVFQASYVTAKQAVVSATVGTDHLWREITHLYQGNPAANAWMVKAAGNLLLRGFALELMDGEAAGMVTPWVTGVLETVDAALTAARKNRLVVMSVLGVQSSGKSTFLNTAFGTRLHTSVGQCTRGINMLLVPRSGFSRSDTADYVLLLDTEGIRAPEYIGLPGTTEHDNMLALMSVLLADACMLVLNGEETGPLREVMPLVAMAFMSSELAHEANGRPRTSLFGAFTRLNYTDPKCERCLHDLLAAMTESVSEGIAIMYDMQSNGKSTGPVNGPLGDSDVHAFGSMQESPTFDAVFSGFKPGTGVGDEHADLHFVGQLNRGTAPPDDVPDPEFGRRVQIAVGHALRSVLSQPAWHSSTASSWKTHLDLVWHCAESNTLSNFADVAEARHLANLRQHIQVAKLRVSAAYKPAYDIAYQHMVREVTAVMANAAGAAVDAVGDKTRMNSWIALLRSNVNSVVIEANDDMRILLGKSEYSKWAEASKSAWEMFCAKTGSSWEEQLKSACSTYANYDYEASRIKRSIQADIRKYEAEGKFARLPKPTEPLFVVSAKREFANIFDARLAAIASDYPSTVGTIPSNVIQEYNRATGNMYQAAILHRFRSQPSPATGRGTVLATATTAGTTTVGVREGATAAGADGSGFLSSVWGLLKRLIGGSPVNPADPDMVIRAMQGHIEQVLQHVEEYDPRVVIDVVRVVNASLMEHNLHRCAQEVHVEACVQLSALLAAKQRTWEQTNNIHAKVAESREQNWQFFLGIIQKMSAGKLLRSQVALAVVGKLQKSIEKHAAEGITSTLLASASWARSPHELRAQVDLDLLNIAETCSFDALVRALRKPTEHFTAIVTQLIVRDMKYNEQVATFQRELEVAFNAATSMAQTAAPPVEPVMAALTSLGAHAYACIQEAGSLDKSAYQLDKEGLVEALEGALADILAAVPEAAEVVKGNIPKQIIKEFASERHASQQARPPCSSACPGCGMLCTKPAGHDTHDSSIETLHDCPHQPSGLFGWHDKGTRTLSIASCKRGVEKNMSFWHGPSEAEVLTPYSKFNSVYPCWTTPTAVATDADAGLMVREYIFFNWNKQLAEHYQVLPSLHECMTSYNRSADQVREKLRKQLPPSE